MLERLRKLLRQEKSRTPGTSFRLCRLRHATLYPGATLWTPGGVGGHLGAGAQAALDDVGVGGEVVVGFQVRVREPVHPRGVLARVEAAQPFPESWEAEGLGADRRYCLLGLARVDLDLETCTQKRVPTVMGVTGPALPADIEEAPPQLVAQLAALASLENHWPDHWLEAFETLPEAALGQWATTLGWRLDTGERLELFDHPERIPEALLSTLDSLHMGLNPARRREAVRRQVVTRRTTAMPERELTVVTDAAGWALFHPADLSAGGETEPAAEEGRLANHLAAGQLVGVRTTPGSAAQVRITSGDLSHGEATDARASAEFRLLVRHGRLFLGGGGVALGNHFQDNIVFADPRHWIDVPNGAFRATVTALGPAAQPVELPVRDEAAAPRPATGQTDPAAPAVPSLRFVVQLKPVEQVDEVPAPSTLPSL